MQLNEWVHSTLPKALTEVCSAKLVQEECICILSRFLPLEAGGQENSAENLLSKYHTACTALLLTSVPQHFSG